MNIQGWSPLKLTSLISLLSKVLSGVFSSTTVWRHQFFGVLPSLWSSSHNRTWPLGTNWVKQCVFLWRLHSSVWGTAGAVKEYIVCTHCVGMCLLTLAVPVPRARRTVANIKDYTFWNYLFFFFKSLIFTCVSKHEPPSHLPPHNISLGHPHGPAPSMLYPALDIDWRFDSYMIAYMFQCHSPKSSHPLLMKLLGMSL